MPASQRGTAAYARVDCQLADWLTAHDLPCRPSRVAGWRAAGLLPVPSGIDLRAGDHPGRQPATWTEAELMDVRLIAARLAQSTGRGTSITATALGLAGEGLPIPPTTVLRAARDQLSQLRRAIHIELRIPSVVDIDRSPEAVTEIVDNYASARSGFQRAIERRLHGSALDADGADAQSVVTLVAEAALGSPPDVLDTDALELTLRAFEVQGLVEPVGGASGPRALDSGPGELAEALELFSLTRLEMLLAEVRAEDVHPALRATHDLGEALFAVPAEIAHHLGATVLAKFLTDNTPLAIVLRLLGWQALQHLPGGTAGMAQIVEAVHDQGWMPHTI